MSEFKKFPVYNFDLINFSPYADHVLRGPIPIHSHTFWEISVSVDGPYCNHFSTGNIICKRNMVLFIRPTDIHYIDKVKEYWDIYIKDEKMKLICSMFSSNLYNELTIPLSPLQFQIDNLYIEGISNSLMFLKNCMKKDPVILESVHTSIISQIIGLYYQASVKENNAMPPWLYNLFATLNLNTISGTNLKEIIQSTGYSHGHVCREFKKYMNCSLISYVNKMKLNHSTALLLDPNMTISEIAQQIGYSNQSNYIISFKKEFGIPPNMWRKKNFK